MSNHPQKYPGLYSGCKAAGLNYRTILMRVRSGMTVKVALATPVGRRGRKPGCSPVRRRHHLCAEDTAPPTIRALREALLQ